MDEPTSAPRSDREPLRARPLEGPPPVPASPQWTPSNVERDLPAAPPFPPFQPSTAAATPAPPPPPALGGWGYGGQPPSMPPTPPGQAATPSHVPPPDPARRRARAATAAVAALALLGGAGGGWLAGHAAAQHSTPSSNINLTRASATLTGDSLNVAQVLQKVEPSVVSITTQITGQLPGGFDYGNGFGRNSGSSNGSQVIGEAAGSGIVLTSDGEVLTNAHVVESASSIAVTLTNGKKYTATLVGKDTNADLALLKLQGASGLTPANLGDSGQLQVGDDVVAIGNALALEGGPTVTRGIVSALDRSIDDENGTLNHLIQTDAAISSGNSGGPLVNSQGQVVGINTAVASSSSSEQASNIGFSISINTVKSLLAELRAGGTAGA